MTRVDPWINWNTELYWFPPGFSDPLFLSSVEAIRVKWLEERDTILTLRGRLPLATKFLKEFKIGDLLYVYHKERGRRGVMEDGEIIMRFEALEILRKWIDYPTVLTPKDQNLITFYIRIKCEFSL